MSQEKKQMLGNLVDKYTMLGKISNNLEIHGEDEVVGFTIPFSALPLEADELNALANDKYFDRCIFNKTAKVQAPCTWLSVFEALKLRETYHEAVVLMTVSGDRELEFDDVTLKDLVIDFDPKYGAVGMLSGKMYLHPGIGKENLILQEHQNRRVKVTITNATVMLKAKSKQQELALEPRKDDGEQPDADAANGEEKPRRKKRSSGERPTAH